jgi:hypothetical protein
MLEKTALNEKDVQVTFRMPPLDGVVELYLCGEFNNWHTAGAPLSLEPDGSWVVTLVLQGGKSYRFRYLDNQGRWHNDWDADAYVPNDFGTEDSVVDLVAPLKKVPRLDVKPRAKGTKGTKGTEGTPAEKRIPEGRRREKGPAKGPAHGQAKGPVGKGAGKQAANGAASGGTASGKRTPEGKNAPPKKGRPTTR